MKKKIKDLTREEFNKICSKHSLCPNCPLLYLDMCMGRIGIIGYKDILEREVEVDE